MKSLIVTVAGTATRFNKDTSEETLKSIYHEGEPDLCLLARILDASVDIDEFIVVGGYLFEKLKIFIDKHLERHKSKIKLIYNPEYRSFGSGYSLILGIKALSTSSKEVIFIEGDLSFDKEDLDRVLKSTKDTITVNHEPITADKAVVVYEKTNGHLQYLYDTKHHCLEIKDAFLAIYNSAQIWKFMNPKRLRQVIDNLTQNQIKGTNLEIIQDYFGSLEKKEYHINFFHRWLNCNTVADYKKTIKQSL